MRRVYVCTKCGSAIVSSDDSHKFCNNCGGTLLALPVSDSEWVAMSDSEKAAVYSKALSEKNASDQQQRQQAPQQQPSPQPRQSFQQNANSGPAPAPSPKPNKINSSFTAAKAGGTGIYSDVGTKICGVAKVVCVIGIVASVIIGLSIIGIGAELSEPFDYYYYDSSAYVNSGATLSGLVVMAIGSLLSWLGSMVLYGFGELINRVNEIAANTRK